MPFLRYAVEERDACSLRMVVLPAFEFDESGAPEVYVMPVDAVGSRRRVSRLGGGRTAAAARWEGAFYLMLDGGVMRVAMTLSPRLDVGC